MAAKTKTDSFANYAAVLLAESAANTQTSQKFAFPFSIMDKMALVLSRIEYWWNGLSYLNTADDRSVAAITTMATLVDITAQNDPGLVDSCRLIRTDFGTAASGMISYQPFIKDFANLPGGGILVAPNPLYLMIQSTGASAALSVYAKVFYTYMELNTDEYWQLVESRRIIST